MKSSGLTEGGSGLKQAHTCHLCRVGTDLLRDRVRLALQVRALGLMDINVSRNALDPQRESFEGDLIMEWHGLALSVGIYPARLAISEAGRDSAVPGKSGGGQGVKSAWTCLSF